MPIETMETDIINRVKNFENYGPYQRLPKVEFESALIYTKLESLIDIIQLLT